MADLSTIENKDDFINRPAEVRNYETFKREFDEEIHRAADSYVRIGYLLTEARDTGILEGSGYATMSDFAKTEYGLSPDQTSRFINVYERFGDGEGHLKTEYSEHGQTKLIEMLSLPDSVAESIPPELPREEIRQIKQEVKEEQQVTPIERAIESSDIPEGLNDLEAFIFVHLKDIDIFSKYWNAMKAMPAYDTESLLKMFDESGIAVITERLPRKGRILLSFNGTNNKPALVDVRQDTRTEIEWDDLHTALSYRLYPEEVISDTPEEDYEVSYGPIEKPAKLVGDLLSEDAENKKVSREAEERPVEAAQSQSATNFEDNDEHENQTKETINSPEGKEIIAPAQTASQEVEDDTTYHRVKRAAKALEEKINMFILDIRPFDTKQDIQDYMDRVEEAVASWRNITIEWRDKNETHTD